MFKSLFGRNDDEDDYKLSIEDDTELQSIRKAVFKIINVQIIYDSDECLFYTAATCINENNKIETINLDDFIVDKDIDSLIGSNIDYEEFEEFEEITVKGRIYKENKDETRVL